jgi:DNA replication protein DnaC
VKTDIPLDTLFKRLHLANARRVWRDLCDRAEKEEWAYDHFLGVLVAEEVAHRQQTRLQKVSRAAGFPFLKTVDDFNFTYQSTVRLPVIGSFLSADFVTEGRSLILHGKPGRGKTHLAIAIAYRAIQNGFDAHFVTAAALIEELSVASKQGKLREAVVAYTHPHVLVVDEIGYLAYGDDAANVLYHVVNQRHLKKRSMIFTTNKPTETWGQVLHDADLGDAIVDRILERGRILKLDGPSIRTKHLGLDDPAESASTQPARISGIRRQEFPEPTALAVSGLPGGVRDPPVDARLVPAPGRAQARAPGLARAGRPAVTVAAIAAEAEEEDLAARRPRAGHEPQ